MRTRYTTTNLAAFCFSFFHPIYYFVLFGQLPLTVVLIVVPQIRGHIRTAGSSPRSPLRYVPCIYFYREKDWALSSLVDSRRIVPTHAIVGALDSSRVKISGIKNTWYKIRRFEPMTSTLVSSQLVVVFVKISGIKNVPGIKYGDSNP